jgi:hypothetical protein
MSVGSLLILAGAGLVQADRGAIPFQPGVTIFEPTQRALIAWNGKEEILVLSTDLRASRATKVLEVMPFPTEPRVKKGDVGVFQRAVGLINAKMMQAQFVKGRTLSQDRASAEAPPPGEITFHERIGAHDVSVARVVSGDGFVDWVNDYLKRTGVGNPVIPPRLRKVVQEYMDDGYCWFAFDVISLEDKFKTLEALQYRFRSPALFYPAKISRANEGQTSMELLVLTRRSMSAFRGIPSRQIEFLHDPVTLTAAEVRWLDKDLEKLLGHRDGVKLRIWQVEGDFASFDRDIIAQ